MGTITRGAKAGGGTDLNSGQTADPAEVNTDFNTIVTEINGNLENVNVKAAAGIVTSKITASCARVTNSGDIGLTTGTVTLMTFDTETFDTDAYHSTGSNTGRLTAPSTGKYLISANVRFMIEATPAANTRSLRIRLNSAGSGAGGTLIGQSDVNNSTTNDETCLTLSIIVSLTAADYVELFATQNSGETYDAELSAAPSHFAIARLGA
jgi:hypothetical protein